MIINNFVIPESRILRKTCYVDGTLMSKVTPVTIPHINLTQHGQTKVSIMVINDWFKCLSFHDNWSSHSWDKGQVT